MAGEFSFRWAFVLVFLMMIISAGFWSLNFVSKTDPAFAAFNKLDERISEFDSSVTGETNLADLEPTSLLDPANLIGQFATFGAILFDLLTAPLVFFISLPAIAVSIVNSFRVVPNEFRLVIGMVFSIVVAFGVWSFIAAFVAAVRR